jgi:hypothetical protein
MGRPGATLPRFACFAGRVEAVALDDLPRAR